MSSLSIAEHISIALGISGIVYLPMAWADSVIREPYKREWGKELQSGNVIISILSWRNAYIHWFDRCFTNIKNGRRVISRKASAIYSLTAFSIVATFVIGLNFSEAEFSSYVSGLMEYYSGPEARAMKERFGNAAFLMSIGALSFIALSGIASNIFIDWISLWQTRYFGERIVKAKSIYLPFILVVADSIISIFIALMGPMLMIVFACVISIIAVLLFSDAGLHDIPFYAYADILRKFFAVLVDSMFLFSSDDGVRKYSYMHYLMFASIVTTILTSMWLWVFLLSSFISRIVRVVSLLDLANSPGKILGGILSGFVFLFYIAIVGILTIVS